MDELPPVLTRWLRPQISSAYLDLPSAPITTANSRETAWQAFTAEESAACEAAWQALTDEERKEAEEEPAPVIDDDVKGKLAAVENDEDDDTVGVSIAKDKLFEVNVRTMKVHLTLLHMLNNIQSKFEIAAADILADERPTDYCHARHLDV